MKKTLLPLGVSVKVEIYSFSYTPGKQTNMLVLHDSGSDKWVFRYIHTILVEWYDGLYNHTLTHIAQGSAQPCKHISISNGGASR